MKRSITILLIDDSPITSVRLVELLQGAEEVDMVFYAKNVEKGTVMFSVSKIDVLILVNQVKKNDLQRLTEICKMFECQLILLSEYSHITYKRWCEKQGIRLLDKNTEVARIAGILKEVYAT